MAAYELPYRLSFAGKPGEFAFKPGRGEAGWTVGRFASKADALAFMAAHPKAAMPCWQRVTSEASVDAVLTEGR